jgi:hypothetical protein
MHMNDGAPLSTAAPVPCYMHPIDRLLPRRESVQHGGRGMTDDGAVMQLRCSREDQLAMLFGVSTGCRSLPYVRTTAYRDKTAVTPHPSQVAVVETLTNKSSREHDVIHVLISARRTTPWEPSPAKSVNNLSNSRKSGAH